MQVLADASLASTASGVAAVEAMHAAVVRSELYQVCTHFAVYMLVSHGLVQLDACSCLCRWSISQQA